MNKFILISFGFMGWAFYEMSGGDEFEPASVKFAHLMPKPPKAAPQVVEPTPEPVIVAVAAPAIVDTDPPLDPLPERVAQSDVTRATVNLNTVAQALADTTTDSDFGVPRNSDQLNSDTDTQAIIPSLIAPGAAQVAAQVTDEVEATVVTATATDVRTVSGNRVNVRGGPSTDFGIVTRLLRGDEVEVLEDNGNGWVRMRPLDGGTEGWMADFLLTGG